MQRLIVTLLSFLICTHTHAGLTAPQLNESMRRSIAVEEDITITETRDSMEKANIGMTDKNRKEVGKILNVLLSDVFLIYVKTLNYHWNVRGIVFHDFHALFKEQYEQLLDTSDEIAERARALGSPAFGTMAEFLKYTQLKEEPGIIPSAKEMIQNLLSDHEAFIQKIRSVLQPLNDEYGDFGTNNFLTEIMERHEKTAWMLRATLEK